jgi:hypothetical protein
MDRVRDPEGRQRIREAISVLRADVDALRRGPDENSGERRGRRRLRQRSVSASAAPVLDEWVSVARPAGTQGYRSDPTVSLPTLEPARPAA